MSAYDNPSFVTDDQAPKNGNRNRKSMNGIGSEAGGPPLVSSYFPQSRPSISDDKSVCTLNIKSLDDDNTRLPSNGEPKPGTDAPEATEEEPGREQWGKGIEFLMSCIAMSVGLGNVWRFPFVALANGGGAFLIPYLIVLLLVGRPIYYLEMCIGQFSSRGSVKVYDFAPALRGIGFGQVMCTGIVATYYTSLMAYTLWYFINSFHAELPWATCLPEWEKCFNSSSTDFLINATVGYKSSAEYYFTCTIFPSRLTVSLFQGVGFGQVLATTCLATYYASVMACIGIYFINSFKNPLPWSVCQPDWNNCMDSEGTVSETALALLQEDSILSVLNNNITALADGERIFSSALLFFERVVLKEITNIDDGVGTPDLALSMSLLVSWVIIMLVLIKGIHSSGKASYFLAIFPYVIMIILLIRAVTLDGAEIGIIYFFRPQWDRILDPSVWFAAVSQVFFSLAVCFGNIIMYSSYNKFRHNVHRDATIVSILDTCTSLLSGVTIFGILGNLAKQMGTDNIHDVVQPGPGLAFVSYPDAIAKFDWLPQLFSVLFFFMLFVLGIGSNIAMASCIITVMRDQFPKLKAWHAAVTVSVIGFLVGLVYVTPGGQMILGLVDFFGASTIVFVLGVGEIIGIAWIYGLNQICHDIEFMLNRKPSLYWRLTWGVITPGILIVVFIYALSTAEPLLYKDTYEYPNSALICGWILAAFGILQVPIWAAVAISKQDEKTFKRKFLAAFRPMENWGPMATKNRVAYQEFMEHKRRQEMHFNQKWSCRVKRWLFG